MKGARTPGHRDTRKKGGRLFIISAPSGCGKTTLCRLLLSMPTGLKNSVSMTTRPKRKGEVEGRDYFFVSKASFQNGIKQHKFLEWTRTYGWYYGTPKKFVINALKHDNSVLLSIDVKGAIRIRRLYPDSTLIFILPPSIKELKGRLKKRNADNKKEINKRIRIVKRELSYVDRYDYCVVNDNINKAASKLKAIIIAEKCKVSPGTDCGTVMGQQWGL